MKRVKIGEFRDRASELIRRAAGGETIVILHRDREVAKVVPIRADKGGGRLVGSLARTAEIRGDIETPIAPARCSRSPSISQSSRSSWVPRFLPTPLMA